MLFLKQPEPTEIYTLSLHDALPISNAEYDPFFGTPTSDTDINGNSVTTTYDLFGRAETVLGPRSEEHTSELQSQFHLVCRLLLEKKKNPKHRHLGYTSQQTTKCEQE